MQERQKQGLSQRWEQFQPSKTLTFWACAACVAVTMVVGFTWGGWMTAGSADKMARSAADAARQDVTAALCVDKFVAAPEANTHLAALKEISSPYQQAKFVQDGGWAATPGDLDQRTDRKAASACAEQLVQLDLEGIAGDGEAAAVVQ